MLVVIALGGNAIIQRGQALEAHIQRENIRIAADSISKVALEHQVVLTHGNGPQIGLLALMNEAYEDVASYPLDVLGAQTQGMIGFMFEQELRNRMPGRKCCTVSTQTVVDAMDTAFQNPTKFVGPVYTLEEAQFFKDSHPEWELKQDGHYYRRVVASPEPVRILELPSLKYIVSAGDITVICGGGGGVPVCEDENGILHSIEAVIDKDKASFVLAEGLNADALILLTDVTAVETDFGQPESRKIKSITPNGLKQFDFSDGSMKPKIESVIRFIESGGKFAAIGCLSKAEDILKGISGTEIKSSVENDIQYYD